MIKSDITGQRYGMLVVLKLADRERDEFGVLDIPKWVCRCDCGNVTTVTKEYLRRSPFASCGCVRHTKMIEKQDFKCKYTYSKCSSSYRGLCCHNCRQEYKCLDACKTTLEKCGSRNNVVMGK